MAKSSMLVAVILVLFGTASALSPTAQLRSTSSDFEYNLAFHHRTESFKMGAHRTRTLNESTAPILRMFDIQSSIEHVSLNGHKNFRVHSHPRAAEVIHVESGNLTVILLFEGFPSVEKVSNSLLRHGVGIVPQGIPHTTQCESKDGCTYVSYYNNANPGRV